MPGGGASGELVYPAYVTQMHALTMHGQEPDAGFSSWSFSGIHDGAEDFNVLAEILTAKELNPYTGVSSYDPDPDLTTVEDRYDEWNDYVEALDPQTLLAAAIAEGVSEVDTSLLDTTYVDDTVDAFEDRGLEAFQRSVGRMNGSMIAARALMNSQYDLTLAYMENQRQAEVNDFDKRLRMTVHEQRATYGLNLAGQYLQLVQMQLNANQIATIARQDIAKLRIVASQDQILGDTAYDEKEVLWRLNLFDYPEKAIASYAGASAIPRPQTTGERLIANVGTALTTGIGAGMAFGNPGAGAIAGVATLALSFLK